MTRTGMLAPMKTSRWIPQLLVALCLLASSPADAGPAVGERLAPLRLPTIDGKTRALHDFRGKKLLLIEFASW